MDTTSVKTTCPYCGVGCGVIATPVSHRAVEIRGDEAHPANFGRLCSKGAALAETLSLDERALHPTIAGAKVGWETALNLVAARFGEAIRLHGPDSVAFYVSGQILTEDYYVANKLMKGFIGSANIDTNSRLCMASSVAGHKRAFGSDTVPGCYEDLEVADLVILVGSNLAWCHPVLYQRLAAAKVKRSTRVVLIDPRRTATAEIADMHLALKPGSDVALFNGLLQHVATEGALDRAYIWRHTSGLLGALKSAQSFSISDIADATGLSTTAIAEFYDLFVRTPRTVTVYSQGVNQSSAGTDKVNAIINCHLATGRIGKPGMGPFSVTGQPNAMGGREVGGLANMLAAHMDIDNPAHREIVQSFWQSPTIASKAGLKAVDMFRAVGDGRIKAIWIMATNPADSMPEADQVRAALAACPFVVVSDVMRNTDTTRYADVLLPALAWGEKDGTVTNSERRISRQRAFLTAPGEARADWWQMAEVAKRLGHGNAFNWSNAREIFAEHAALTAQRNNGKRDLDIDAHAANSDDDYAALEPFQWPARATATGDAARFFARGGFYTPDQRARFIATPYRQAASSASDVYPLLLNTGRIRDQWHTMTRTGLASRLMKHTGEPFVEIHPSNAAKLSLAAADLASITSERGHVVARVLVTDRVQAGSVFMPIHWTDQFASRARVDALVGPHVDPVSGQPELKHTPVRIERYAAGWYGFAVSVSKPVVESIDYWALARGKYGWRSELAGLGTITDWRQLFCDIVNLRDPSAELLAYHDQSRAQHRFALFEGARLTAAAFFDCSPVGVSRGYLDDQLGATFEAVASRYRLLAGRAGGDTPDAGPIVCACLDVGRNQIVTEIASGRCSTVEAIGNATRAGTNCGACRPEIGALIDAARVSQAGRHLPVAHGSLGEVASVSRSTR